MHNEDKMAIMAPTGERNTSETHATMEPTKIDPITNKLAGNAVNLLQRGTILALEYMKWLKNSKPPNSKPLVIVFIATVCLFRQIVIKLIKIKKKQRLINI